MKYRCGKKEIKNKEEWKKEFCAAYSGKDDDKHWKEGRSAERLANHFMGENASGEETMIEMIQQLLNADGINQGENEIDLEYATIEHASKFDSYKRPRIQDLAIWGTAAKQEIFIGIEAKVDESFGSRTISGQRKYVETLLAQEKRTDADKRLNELVNNYLGGDEPAFGKIRYQLLYYLAGSVNETPDIVFMPVITYNSSAKNNLKAYTDLFDKLNNFNKIIKDANLSSSAKMEVAYKGEVEVKGKKKTVYTCYIKVDEPQS